MKKRRVLLALLVSGLVAPQARAIDVPGLGLDNPGLPDLRFGGSYGFGRKVDVKGANNPKESYGVTAVSQFRGRLLGGVIEGPQFLNYAIPTTVSGTTATSYTGLSSTLVPVFALGAVAHATNTSFGTYGPFLQATIYEPDQVKRKGGKKPRVQLKQNSYLAFRWGQFSGSGLGGLKNLSGGLVVPDCKGQADFRQAPTKNPATVKLSGKMKVKCSGKSAEVQEIKGLLQNIFGKSRSGFDLAGAYSAYP